MRSHVTRTTFSLVQVKTDGPAEDWHAYFDERIEIAMSNGLPRAEAEALAFEECGVEWLNPYPAPSAPGHCAWCGTLPPMRGPLRPW